MIGVLIPVVATASTSNAPAPQFKTIDAGEIHSLAIDVNNTLWAWGGNSRGQLGDGTTENRLTPIRVVVVGF
jgi:alpha-tubulin suppressor-like RCC1 family protein